MLGPIGEAGRVDAGEVAREQRFVGGRVAGDERVPHLGFEVDEELDRLLRVRVEEQLELDVVRIAEDEHRGAGDRIRRRDRRERDARLGEASSPRVELVAVLHCEREMVETGARLVERFVGAALVLREAEASAEAVVTEEHLPARVVGSGVRTDRLKAQHIDVPGRARLDIAHGEAQVVNVFDHPHPSLRRTSAVIRWRQVVRCDQSASVPELNFDERIATRYETYWPNLFDPAVVDPAVDFLAELGGGGALEFGIGTGRLALPLRAAVCACTGSSCRRRWWRNWRRSRVRPTSA